MKRSLLTLPLLFASLSLFSQTLQTVTDSGNTTSNMQLITGSAKTPTVGKGLGLTFWNNSSYLVSRDYATNADMPMVFQGSSFLMNLTQPFFIRNNAGTTARGGGFIFDETGGGRSTLVLDANGGDGIGLDYSMLTHFPGQGGLTIANMNAAPMSFLTNGTKRMTIDGTTGYVGIGTANPSALLSVNGEIRTKKVRVTLNASDWPDYVFMDAYQLPSLQELEQYVERHRHLPGVPSADVIASEGLELGDMQKLQMQKIEELTLYIIQQNKRIEALEARLAAVEGQ